MAVRQDFLGRVALVTGASGGLGRNLAVALAARGAQLAVFARRENELRETARLAGEAACLVCAGDITSEEDLARLLAETGQRFGRLDYLLNNAGVSMWASVAELESSLPLRRLMEVNYFGAAWCAKLALPLLRESRGMIVNISSIQSCLPLPAHSGYAASKKALEGFFESLNGEEPEVSVLNARLSWVAGTGLSRSRVAASQPRARSADDEGLDVDMVARRIIAAMAAGRERITLPSRYACLPLAVFAAPRRLRMIGARRVRRRLA